MNAKHQVCLALFLHGQDPQHHHHEGFGEKIAPGISEILRRVLDDLIFKPIDIFNSVGFDRVHHQIRCANGQRDSELAAKQTRSESVN